MLLDRYLRHFIDLLSNNVLWREVRDDFWVAVGHEGCVHALVAISIRLHCRLLFLFKDTTFLIEPC